ncbi:MAG TPA: endonuclease/exonuclease/phosphatase family protein, partial [Acidimicrobiales bacterium]|nr:endonuclease/exonuclease/phosphatase family protein [Acidimicrobiales bacterium]
TVGDVARRPSLGPLPSTREIGRRLTDLHHGVLRSAFSGQGNAITVSPRNSVLDHAASTLNPRRFRDAQARRLGLGAVARLAWGRERRVVQAVRIRVGGGRTYLVANLHCTSYPDRRLAQAELLRAAWFATSTADAEDVVVLAGDFNLTTEAEALRELLTPEWGFRGGGPGIDQVLVRGARVGESRRWPTDRRRVSGRLLSDHAPVEVEIE